MNGVGTIAGATIRRFIRSRSFFVLGFVAPFLIMAALAVTIGSALAGEFRPTLVIVDPSGGDMSNAVASGLLNAGFDDITVTSDETSAVTAVENTDADAAIILPASLFDPNGGDDPIRIVVDAEREATAGVAEAIASQFSLSAAAGRSLLALGVAPIVEPGPITVAVGGDVGSSVLTDSTYFAVGMTSFFTTFAAIGFMASFHQERRQSTLARLLLAPIGRTTPILGMALGVLVVTSISIFSLIAASTLLLDASWGPPLGVIIIAAALVFTAVSVATGVVAVTSSESSAGQIGIILVTAWAAFGGVFVEIPTSGPMALISKLSPFTWTLSGVGLNAGTGTLGNVLTHAAIVACFGVVALVIAAARHESVGRL